MQRSVHLRHQIPIPPLQSATLSPRGASDSRRYRNGSAGPERPCARQEVHGPAYALGPPKMIEERRALVSQGPRLTLGKRERTQISTFASKLFECRASAPCRPSRPKIVIQFLRLFGTRVLDVANRTKRCEISHHIIDLLGEDTLAIDCQPPQRVLGVAREQ